MSFLEMNVEEWQAILVSLKLAGVTTLILVGLGVPMTWFVVRAKKKYRLIMEPLMILPVVLPPTVLGFYLLLFLGKNGPLSFIYDWLGVDTVAFTFEGLVIGSCLYSLPFVFFPLKNVFSNVQRAPLELAYTLGDSPSRAFFRVVIPLCRGGIITAAIFVFAHTLGEFGIIMMLGGNISGETKVASVLLYEHVESFRYEKANTLAFILLLMSFSLMLLAQFIPKWAK